MGLHRFTVGFPSYCMVFYIFIINVYIIIYITKLKYPPLAFGVREGMGGAVVAHKRIENPPLTFKAREGIKVAIVTQKRIQNPSTHVWSEGGDRDDCCCLEKNTRTPHSHLKLGRGWGGHCHPEKNTRIPHLHLQRGRGSLLLLPIKEKPPLLMFAARGLLLLLPSHCC
jgi:hypothetical protein